MTDAASEPPQPRKADLFERILFWGCLSFVLVVFVALVMPDLEMRRGPGRYFQCRNNLKRIELALHNYHDTYGSFPPAVVRGPDGTPWHSWRVLLLPFIEQQDLYEKYRFDEPWDGPNNRLLAEALSLGSQYFCPADDAAYRDHTTSYLAVVGEGTLWPPDAVGRLDDLLDATGTIHVVEVSNSGIHWMEPQDLSFETMNFAVNAKSGEGIRADHPGEDRWFGTGPPRANVSFADGEAKPLDAETPPETVRSMLLRSDGKP